MRMMGAESVAYHRATVIERGDDHPGLALEYYASRGETPMVWGGSGSLSLGLSGPVSPAAYEAVFGPGGACDRVSGDRLVATRRPGMELVISAHKSVAELGVIGRADDMHTILDAERDATLAYLDGVTRQMGGRRGRAATATMTAGLIYAHTRHATSRAGDPCPHDHVLIANVVEMLDEAGGWKAADTTLWREHLHAATMVGRLASARAAVALGYGIEPDAGPSGKLGQWRIAGIPDEVLAVHSKRAAEITAECARRGETGYRARGVAARTTRSAKTHDSEAELVSRWRAELAEAGWPVERIAGSVADAAHARRPVERLTWKSVRRMVAEVLGDDGDPARRKVFSRRHVIVALAPRLFGQDPAILDPLAARALADPEAVPLVGVAGARERVYSLASVIARETAIADSLERQLTRIDGPTVPLDGVEAAAAAAEADLGASLSAEQRDAAVGMCTSGRGAELVVGVAGAGKTTMLAVVAAAFGDTGHQVLGTATSGQAARTLGTEAGIDGARTVASLVWRLDHAKLALDDRSVVILDEAGMTDDVGLARLAAHTEAAGAKLIVVGDHRQLGAVGPGGALAALVGRHPDAVHQLMGNRRQTDPDERRALAALRDGEVGHAVAWYAEAGRVHPCTDRDGALQAAVDAWAADVTAGRTAGLYAWRRGNVAELNRRARDWMETTGRLSGPEISCHGGAVYRAGDRIVALAPTASMVTSQAGTVDSVDHDARSLVVRTDDGSHVTLALDEAGSDRLGYGYATSVHRAQGATIDAAHLLADGGGRELAYVGMSRARHTAHAWVVADDLPQAAEDLRRDWSTTRTPTWAIDTGQPTPGQPGTDALTGDGRDNRITARALTHARMELNAKAVSGVAPSDLGPALTEAREALRRAEQARADLAAGGGSYLNTEAGKAAADLARARAGLADAQGNAAYAPRWRDRRTATRDIGRWAALEADASQRWQDHVAPEAERLDHQITEHRAAVGALAARHDRRQAANAGFVSDALGLRRNADRLAAGVDAYRARLDGPHRDPRLQRPARRLGPRAQQTPWQEPEPTAAPDL